MPTYTRTQFAERIRQVDPLYRAYGDDDLISGWLEKYPGDADSLITDEQASPMMQQEVAKAAELLRPPSILQAPEQGVSAQLPSIDKPWERPSLPAFQAAATLPARVTPPEPPSSLLPTAARVGLPMAGGIAGGWLGKGPGGARLGAGLGGAVGEALAQTLEGEPINLPSVAAMGLLSSYLPVPLRGATSVPAAIGIRAAEGAALSGAGTAGQTLLREGRLPTKEEIATALKYGAAMGIPFAGVEAAQLARARALLPPVLQDMMGEVRPGLGPGVDLPLPPAENLPLLGRQPEAAGPARVSIQRPPSQKVPLGQESLYATIPERLWPSQVTPAEAALNAMIPERYKPDLETVVKPKATGELLGAVDQPRIRDVPRVLSERGAIGEGPLPRDSQLTPQAIQKGIAEQGKTIGGPAEPLPQPRLTKRMGDVEGLSSQFSYDDAGRISGLNLLGPMTGTVAGGLAGATQGDTLEDRLINAALGATAGGVAGHYGVRALGRQAVRGGPAPPQIPALAQMALEREAILNPPKGPFFTQVQTKLAGLQRKLIDQIQPMVGYRNAKAEEISTLMGRPYKVPFEVDPVVHLDTIYGGQGGGVIIARNRYKAVAQAADKGGLTDYLRYYLELKGMGHGLGTLGEKARIALSEGRIQDYDNIIERVAAGEAMPVGYTPEGVANDLAQLQSQAGSHWQQVEELGQQVFQLNRDALDTAFQGGLIKPTVYQRLMARPDDYVPLARVLDMTTDASRVSRGMALDLKKQGVLFNLKGSERVLQDPLMASFVRHAETIYEVGRNDAAKAITNLRHLEPEPGYTPFASDIYELAPGQRPKVGEGAIGLYDQGEAKRFAVPEPIASMVSMANADDLKLVGNAVLRAGVSLLRNTAVTLSPAWVTANIVRDVRDLRRLFPTSKEVIVVDPRTWGPGAKSFFQTLGAWTEAFGQRLKQDPEYVEMMQSRAGFSTLVRNLQLDELSEVRDPSVLANPVKWFVGKMGGFSNAVEETTKLAAWKMGKAANLTPLENAYAVRRYGGSPDYGRKGTLTPSINTLLVFFNAQLQGIVRNVERYKSDPKKLMWVMAGASATALLRDRWNSQFVDSDGVQAEKKISDTDRKGYFTVVLPSTYIKDGVVRHHIAKLPKGYTDQIITNIPESVICAVKGDISPAQAMMTSTENIFPGNITLKEGQPLGGAVTGFLSSVNPVLGIPVEQLANRQMAFNAPIVTERLTHRPAEEQFTPATSPTIVKMAQAASAVTRPLTNIGVSPDRLSHVLRRSGLAAGPGEMVLTAADALLRAGGQAPPRRELAEPEQLAQTPIIGPLLRRFVGSSFDQVQRNKEEQFYQALGEAEQIKAKLSQLQQEQPEQLRGFLREPQTRAKLTFAGRLMSRNASLGTVRRQERMLEARGVQGSDPRMARLLTLERQIVEQGLADTAAYQKVLNPSSHQSP